MSEFRGFIAIDIEAGPKIIKFEELIKKTGANVKLVEPENIHITLKFLGNTDEERIADIKKIIKSVVEDVKPFKISLEGTGVFPDKNYIKVIWAGIKNSEKIEKIAEEINEKLSKLGFKKDKRKFSAHLTIGRVKTAKHKDKLLQILDKYKDFKFAEFEVKSIELKKSQLTPNGPVYTTLAEINF